MKLGPFQEAWVKSLEEHPERQTDSILAVGSLDDYKACCLGEGAIVYAKMFNLPIVFKDNELVTDGGTVATLPNYKLYGLRSSLGKLENEVIIEGELYMSLSGMNDSGKVTWPQIAKYIKENPENVFTHSV